ncbi:membrane-targeted effector domain-containing toxin [Pseudomonas sp. SWRI99]|uniref:membrane-targeted effector domain-containing toxin n=1 Tax=Pseudomonas sp. SWRI99 TaxID=2745506 RepID=UPI0016461955|nr:membrane-targeted effector domain-containing toxin [Pseudomonas sp. SWRI99]MBC3775271.1 membrane-targeted effector domain-containing toxin [Pseudomonas sp. SWRI99]
MSTPNSPPSPAQVKSDLNQIGQNLFKIDTPLLAEQAPSAEQLYLKGLNDQLKNYRERYLQRSRPLYQELADSDLHSEEGKKLLATLKIRLNTQLINLDLSERIDGKPAKTYLIYDAGFTAVEHEARQAVADRLLNAPAATLIEKIALAPILRPAMYALQFSYQDNIVELAGAFVITEENSPQVSDLLNDQSVGYAVLFTPARGIEFFDSLADLDAHLLQCVKHASAQAEFMQMLPRRFHEVGVGGIWPLQLTLIDSEPLFEHTYDAVIDKRTQDVERALSLIDNPQHDAGQLCAALDRAVTGALPDLTPRLELHAQTLFERNLYYSAPDWYRSASETRQTELGQHLHNYSQARHDLLQLMGAAASPPALARYQWLERLGDDLEIDDLDPDLLQIKTRRYLAGFGVYEHKRSLTDLALLGPHTGDELAGSDFLLKTTLTYNNAPLPEEYADVTPAWLIRQTLSLQPRIDFSNVQKQMHALPAVSQAIEHMFDQRIVALAYTAWLQGHLLASDWQLIQDLRAGNASHLQAALLSLHGAQLQDLWVLRQSDASGALKRVLLCTPQAPREQQFQAFASELECQTHLLGWAAHNDAADSMKAYLVNRTPLRFRQNMQKILAALGFKPEAMEHKEVKFINIGTHRDCLRAMTRHLLATRVDDYDFGTPLWYRSTSASNRKKLTTLTEEAECVLRAFDKHPSSGSGFQGFDAYVHEQAKISLNRLLNRPANDVDPDSVRVHAQTSVVPSQTPAPLTYTRLFRDGYPDNFGLIDPKISQSARFTGPPGIDVSALTPQNVARSVTGVWIGQRYTDKVKAELQSAASVGYGLRRNTTLAITQRQMKRAALECQLQGHIASADLQWLEQSIASLGDTTPATRTRYALHRLMIDGEWVIDTWLFSHDKNPVLLYTPQAPDGVSFREARLFNYLLKQQPGFGGYLAGRVGVQAQSRVRTFLDSARKGLPDTLNRTTPSPARYDSTRSVAPVSDMRYALYDMKLQRKIDDVHATTTSRAQMIGGLIWTCVEWVTAIATAPFPLLSLTTGVLLAFKDAMLALHAYRQGDNAMALQHLLGYLFNSAGALLTDLRPALRSLKHVVRLPRLRAAAAAPEQAMKLIEPLEAVSTLPTDIQPVVFRGRTLWAAKNPDSLGRYLLHRLDPDTSALRSTGILVSPNADGVMVRSGVAGGAPKYEAVSDTPGLHKEFGIPPQYRDRLESAMNPETRKEIIARSKDFMSHPDTIVGAAVMDLHETRKAHLLQVEKLTAAATRHWDTLAPLSARAPVPAVAADMTFTQLIASEAFSGKSLVIGARPGSIASKQALITYLDTLIERGFKRLYLEYLPDDVFHLKLEKLNTGGTWQHIKKHLKAIDRALGYPPKAPFSFVALVREARKKGLKIKALDASTSYQLDDVLKLEDVSPLTPRGNNIRNFYSHKAIAADTADAPNDRWIVLADESRMVTHNTTPGLADLHDAIALRIEDVALGQPASIKVDTAGAITGDAAAKGDYHMTLPTAYKAPRTPAKTVAASGSGTGHFDEFDIASVHHEQLHEMHHQPRGMDPRYGHVVKAKADAADAFIDMRKKLLEKAESHFTHYTPPARATLPTLTTDATADSLFKQVADGDSAGLVLGEAHSAQSSKALLIKQLEKHKGQYKTLYVEHLQTDLHQADLDDFCAGKTMSAHLRRYLSSQDEGHMRFYKGTTDNYTSVIEKAAKYGYRIRALDCVASYHMKGLSDPRVQRNRMFSYFASRVIEADQLANGPHKWIAFVGSAHTGYNLGVPGLADMLGAVSLHVHDTTPALAQRLQRGYWEVATESMPTATRAIRSDFRLEVGIPGKRLDPSPAAVQRERLTEPGQFIIERPNTRETRLVHRSRTGEVVETPIQVDDKGLFFIDYRDRALDRFKTLEELIMMLRSEFNLRPVT